MNHRGWLLLVLPLLALALQPAAWFWLESLFMGAFGPDALDPHGRHVTASQAWLAVYGFSSVSLGLAAIYAHLRWAHPALAVPTMVVLLPGIGLGTFSLYFWLACRGWV